MPRAASFLTSSSTRFMSSRGIRMARLEPKCRNSGPQSELSSLALSHDGSVLFGTQEERNQVLSFTIDRSSGMPTLASTTPAGTRPNSAAVDVSNRFVYVTNGSSNISKNNDHEGSANLSEYTVTPAGIMTQLPGSPIATGAAPKAVVVASF
ncbi:MAG: hypothetical protein DMG60_01315 [Acidobacteria bacterium]|nr:MAG: hypothetical protein DMG60_01315 [Acidobacteriota bacterium]